MKRVTLRLLYYVSLFELPHPFWVCRNSSKYIYSGKDEDMVVDYGYHLAFDIDGVRRYWSVFADYMQSPDDVVSDAKGHCYFIYKF